MRYFLAGICLFSLLSSAPGAWGAISPTAPGGKPRMEKLVCLTCHTANWMKPQYRVVVPQWRKSIHYQNDVACNKCHGGDPKNAALAMSPKSGFVGAPKYQDVPQFCGKCHIGIMQNYLDSGHGKALKTTGKGPNCVTCHGSHDIQPANIQIINESLCGRCHSYDRAKTMKASLMLTEMKIKKIDTNLKTLKAGLISTEADQKILFRTQEGFRALFHTVDVKLVQTKTAAFDQQLAAIQARVQQGFQILSFRRNFSLFLMLIFIGLAITLFLLSRRSG